MSRVLIGTLVAGIAIFVWGFVYWGMSPLPYSALSRTTDDVAAGAALTEYLPQTGTYYIPGRQNPPEVLKSLHDSGPLAWVFFSREGRPMMSPRQMVLGFVHSLAFAFVVGMALYLFGGALVTYAERMGLLALIGLASALWEPLFDMIWWYYPPGWQLWRVLYDAVVWLILALVLAHFVRPRSAR